jgi:hypothetical protein
MPSGLTVAEVLDIFSAFAQDFENFEYPENPKVVCDNNPASFLNETSSRSDESESSSEGFTLPLDEMALIYAEWEDMESEMEEAALSGTASQIDEAAPAMDDKDSVMKGMVGLVMDEADPLSEVSASPSEVPASPSKASASSSEVPASPPGPTSRSSKSSGFFDDTISFVLLTGEDGSITSIESENYQLGYQYYIDLKPKQILELESLRFFIEVIKREQVYSSALLKFITFMADVFFNNFEIKWLPALLRNGVSEIVHELVFIWLDFHLGKANILSRATLRYLEKWLPDAGFVDGNEQKFTPFVRDRLEEFSRVTRLINPAEVQMFLYIHNLAVLPDIQSMVSPTDILLFCKIKTTSARISC